MKAEQPIANYNGSPQKENGYTPIANELLEAIMFYSFSKRQLQVILAIARMTYGYSKKKDALSGWQISKLTKIDRSDISKTIDELVKLNVVIKHENGRLSHGILVNEISINKYYETWLTVGNIPTVGELPPLVKNQKTVGELPKKPLAKHPTHKAIKTTKTSTVKTSIPKDFCVSDRVIKWASEKGYSNLDAHLEYFILACEKGGLKYVNWDSGFMTAIRENWAKIKTTETNKKPDWLKV